MSRNGLKEKVYSLLKSPFFFITGLFLYWMSWVLHPRPAFDEGIYLHAFYVVQQGQSPYLVSGYFYPPPLAYLGGGVLSWLGSQGTLFVLRLANLLGAIWLVRLTLRPFSLPTHWNNVVFLVALAMLPPIAHGLEVNNLSIFTAALGIAALQRWPKLPLAAACLLAVSLLIKPMLSIAWLLLMFYPHASARKTAIYSGILTSFVLACFWWELPAMLHQMTHNKTQHTQLLLSWRNLFQWLGISLPGWGFTACWSLVGLWWIRRNTPSIRQLEAGSITLSLYSLPIVWDHTLSVILPMMGLLWHQWLQQKPLPPPHNAIDQQALQRWALKGMGLGLLSFGLLYSDRLGDLIDTPAPFRLCVLGSLLFGLGWIGYKATQGVETPLCFPSAHPNLNENKKN